LRDWTAVLTTQFRMPETRPQAYAFLDQNFDALARRMRDDEVSWLFMMLGVFCDSKMGAAVNSSFAPRAAKVDGGPFHLAQASEAIEQCVRVQGRLRPGVTAWLGPSATAAAPR
jgi:hypothetical protein